MVIHSKWWQRLLMFLLSVLLLSVVVFSWIFNMGWVRFALFFSMLPLVHIVLFFIINLSVIKYFKVSQTILVWNILFNLSFVLYPLFLPDGGDIGPMYVFFGLFNNNVALGMGWILTFRYCFLHIFSMLAQFLQMLNLRKYIIKPI